MKRQKLLLDVARCVNCGKAIRPPELCWFVKVFQANNNHDNFMRQPCCSELCADQIRKESLAKLQKYTETVESAEDEVFELCDSAKCT